MNNTTTSTTQDSTRMVNDYFTDPASMATVEIPIYDPTDRHRLVDVEWKISEWISENSEQVSATVVGVDNRGRDWDGVALFDITERVESYDDIEDEDYYLIKLSLQTVVDAGCTQDHQDRRIDSAMGLIRN